MRFCHRRHRFIDKSNHLIRFNLHERKMWINLMEFASVTPFSRWHRTFGCRWRIGRNIINSITRSAVNRLRTCWLESVDRKWDRRFFSRPRTDHYFCWATLFDSSRGNLFSYIFFSSSWRNVAEGSRAFRKWSTRSAGTLLVIYSLFTYIWTSSSLRWKTQYVVKM